MGKLNVNLGLFVFEHKNEAPDLSDPEGAGNPQKVENKWQFLTLGGCFDFNDGFCGGLKLTDGTLVNKTNSGKTETKWSGLGVSLGYIDDGGFSGIFTYFFDGKKELKSDNFKISYTESQAYQLDLGYGFKVQSVKVGPMLSIIHFDFAKVKSSGFGAGNIDSTIKPKEKDDFIIPSFAVWADF